MPKSVWNAGRRPAQTTLDIVWNFIPAPPAMTKEYATLSLVSRCGIVTVQLRLMT